MSVEKFMFINHVIANIEDHPEWSGDTYKAVTQGIMNRLKKEIDQRSKCETALSMCYDVAKDKLPDNHKEIVKQAVKTSFSFGGSKYAEEL